MLANALEADPPTTARVLQHFFTKLLETEELLQDWHYTVCYSLYQEDSKQNNFRLNSNKCGQAAYRPTSGFQKIKTK